LIKKSYYLIFLLWFGCTRLSTTTELGYPESRQKVRQSKNGVVVTGHPLATNAGVEMLSRGGNAVDAAIAAAFTLAVVEPSMSGIGGRTQILIYSSETGFHGIDGTTAAPSDYDYENAPKKRYGYPSIGVPGVVKGLTKALSEHGSLSRIAVMSPAIEIADKGHSLIPGEAIRLALVNEQLKEFEGSRQHFLNKDGSPLVPGEWFVQKDLAKVLKAVAIEGPDVFYSGRIAEKLVADNKANGGVLSMKAMAEYEAKDSHIVKGSYRGNELTALWMPSFGAITIEALQILESLSDDLSGNQTWGENVFHAIEAAYLDRREQKSLSDADRLTSKDWAKKRATEVHNEQVFLDWNSLPESYTAPMGHTTHLTVVDKNGMIVSLTQTVGTIMGSKVATPGLGFVYAQTLGGYLGEVKGGDRAPSHISPIIVSKDENPILALGAAGGSRIPSSIVAVISRVIDQDQSLENAVALPRVQPTKDGVDIEFTGPNGFTLSDSTYFASLGHMVTVQRQKARFGRVHAVMKSENGWVGVADPDWEGSAGSPK
jgi:gamma-glutamyltranspeptidase/glutathione hydrolase|tara:strand:- start:28930 stop:30555 length:1626 start_codon:yes stop_codon:yes gene_type:complete